MKNKKTNRYRLAAAILLFALCMAAAHALAANATTVYVNNCELDGTAGKTYWRNGNLTADSNNWNAFFDTGTTVPTLRLRGAIINTVHTVDPVPHDDTHALIYGDGDFILSFSGSSTLSFNGSVSTDLNGVQSSGNLIITEAAGETGSLTIHLTNTDSDGASQGIGTDGALTIESGTIGITVSAGSSAVALNSNVNLRMNGGQITANSISESDAAGISVTNAFYMMDGTIAVTVSGPSGGFNPALGFDSAEITGGEGRFESSSMMCLFWDDSDINDFTISGGHMVFSCVNGAALSFYSESITKPNTTLPIWVSPDNSGAGKALWNASMGQLANSLIAPSYYRYVEFGSAPDPKKPEAPPQTGDSQSPLLWLGIGLIMLSGMGALLCVRRKWRARSTAEE